MQSWPNVIKLFWQYFPNVCRGMSSRKPKSDLSSRTNFDQIHTANNYEFGKTLSWSLARAFLDQTGLWRLSQ